VLIESEADHTMDLEDMKEKILAHPEARFMLVSHMRGKLCDMDKVVEMCKKHDITMIEDCAHTTGVFWGDAHTGHHGIVSCYSTQSHKAINSGEGGFLCTGVTHKLFTASTHCTHVNVGRMRACSSLIIQGWCRR
jgi:dTDP-4-amino-4,6-dideoxygalactose transaminase